MSAHRSRLGPEDWLTAGLAALTESGPDALKAERLARALGTTKGSFYWHFKDIDAFRTQLAGHWQAGAEAMLWQSANLAAPAAERLRNLAAIIGDGASEAAVRAWARFDDDAAAAVEKVDEARLAHIGAVLDALGLTNPEFARIVYAAHIGMLTLPGADSDAMNDSARSTLTAALLALQDA